MGRYLTLDIGVYLFLRSNMTIIYCIAQTMIPYPSKALDLMQNVSQETVLEGLTQLSLDLDVYQRTMHLDYFRTLPRP